MDSEIHVLPDGNLRVLETIRIRSAGQKFKHGLQREFPRTYVGPFGSRAEVTLNVEEVLRDGSPEPFTLARKGNDAVLRAGESDVLLAPGEYTYRITYVTDRQLGFFGDHDELYWNASAPADACRSTGRPRRSSCRPARRDRSARSTRMSVSTGRASERSARRLSRPAPSSLRGVS